MCESLDVCLLYQLEISFHLLTMWILKGTRRHVGTPAMPFMNKRISVTVWAFYLCFSFLALLRSQLHFRGCMCKQVASWGRFRSCFNAWGAEFYRRAVWKQRLQFWEISVASPSFSQLWLQKCLSFKEICTSRHLLHLAFLHSQIFKETMIYYLHKFKFLLVQVHSLQNLQIYRGNRLYSWLVFTYLCYWIFYLLIN